MPGVRRRESEAPLWLPSVVASADVGLPLGGEAVLLSCGELDGRPRRFEFPVDGLPGRPELFDGAQRLDDVRVTRPSGFALRDDPGLAEERTSQE